MKTLALVLALAFSAAAPASATSIQVVASTATPTSGELFTITIQALNLFDGFQPLDLFYGFGFDIVNAPGTGTATYDSVVAGPLFGLLSVAETDVVGLGVIDDTATEPVVLAVLTFLAGTPGTVELGATANVDPLNEPNAGLFYSVESGPDAVVFDLEGTTSVTVQAASVPETFSFGLPLGLMALIGARRFLGNR